MWGSTPKVFVDSQHAWGYYLPEDFGKFGKNPDYRNFIYLHNTLNALSIFCSPLVGLVRCAVAGFFLLKLSEVQQKNVPFDLKAAERFLHMELARSVMEVFCLGPVLGTAVDGYVTLKHHERLQQALSQIWVVIRDSSSHS